MATESPILQIFLQVVLCILQVLSKILPFQRQA